MTGTATCRGGVTRRQLLARIHCLKKEAGWGDDEYRDILQAKVGKRSCTELDFTALSRAVALVAEAVRRSAGGKPAEWDFIWRASEEKRPLLRKIFATCRALGVGRTYAEGVAKRQNGGVQRRLEMMSAEELYKVAQALANTQRHRAEKATQGAGTAPAKETKTS